MTDVHVMIAFTNNKMLGLYEGIIYVRQFLQKYKVKKRWKSAPAKIAEGNKELVFNTGQNTSASAT